MNKIYIVILLCLLTTGRVFGQKNAKHVGNKHNSFSTEKNTEIGYTKDSVLVDSIYIFDAWTAYFKPTKTRFGAIIKHKIISDSSYVLQWGNSNFIGTYPDTFSLDGHETWIPKLIDEDQKYLVLRQGCGNPCWTGYFLPTTISVRPLSVPEYLGYDLKDDLVVYVKSFNILEVINIKTRKTQDFELKGCRSAFLGYCIDSLTIKDKILKFKWSPDSYMDSTKEYFKIEKIKI